MAINVLNSVIANRISAGEVVENPASIVKELLDNAIDAGADEITIDIISGGIDMIAIRDNGCGIEEADLPKAFLPHATSKIARLEDLDNIATLGFRGEALPSISSVCQVTMISKTRSSDYANKIQVNGGEFGEVVPTAGKDGTYIEVRNLFFNTPARRKFLRRAKSEENEITNYITQYILAHPSVKLKYTADGKTIYDNKGGELIDALSCVYGAEITQNVLPVNYSDGDIHLSGYAGKISYTKPNTTYQTLLINGRYVIDQKLSKAVYSAYEEFLMTRQFPFYVINLTMPYDQVDVNVHPNKMNVKFAKPDLLFDIFYRAMRQTIYSSVNPTSNVPTAEYEVSQKGEETIISLTNSGDADIDYANQVYDKIVHLDVPNVTRDIDYKDSVKRPKPANFEPPENPVDEEEFNKWLDNKESEVAIDPVIYSDLNTPKFNPNIVLERFVPQRNASFFDNEELKSSEENPAYQPIANFSKYKVIGEIFSEFLILEKDDVMLLVDFHAGHERLLYDKLVAKVNSSQLDIQTLLVPYYHTVNVKEMEYILNLHDELLRLGFDIEQSGPNEVRVASVPTILSDINIREFVQDLLHDLSNQKPNINYKLDHSLMQKACKSAVKAGMTLSEMQINELLKNFDVNQPVLLCPHGRPIVTVIKRSQIEKWFKRIV